MSFVLKKGRKSRRMRRIAKDKWLKDRGDIGSLSFVLAEEPKEKSDESGEDSNRSNSSRSRSRSSSRGRRHSPKARSSEKSSDKKSAISYITCFGAAEKEEEENVAASAVITSQLLTNSLSNQSSLKLLKRNLAQSRSRSRSKSPVAKITRQLINNSDDEKFKFIL
jgi:hypothetical protein